MDTSKAGWLYISGAISFAICSTFFFGLIAYMVYRTPTIKLSDIWSENFVIDEALLKSLQANAIDIIAVPSAEEELALGAPKPAVQSVKELFGESNATLDPSELLLPSPKTSQARAVVPDASRNEDQQGRESRLENIELTQFSAINTAQTRPNPASQQALESRYYSMIYKLLYSEWRIVPSDLGKIAWIEMRIDRGGAISYRVTSAPSDQYFVDRLESALSRVKAAKVEPPPRSLTLNVKFEVREQ